MAPARVIVAAAMPVPSKSYVELIAMDVYLCVSVPCILPIAFRCVLHGLCTLSLRLLLVL